LVYFALIPQNEKVKQNEKVLFYLLISVEHTLANVAFLNSSSKNELTCFDFRTHWALFRWKFDFHGLPLRELELFSCLNCNAG